MPERTPNLVFFFPDQLRAHAMGFMAQHLEPAGNAADPVHTPRLDAFAKQSTTLTQAVSTYPVCSPYRAMLMSGRYPYPNTVIGNVLSPNPWELQDDHTCLTDVLVKNGYDVGYIGKWHLTRPTEPFLPDEVAPFFMGGVWNCFTPPEKRHGISHWHGHNDFDNHFHQVFWPHDAGPNDYVRAEGVWGPEYEVNHALQYLENAQGWRDPDKPFALFISVNPPHPPYDEVAERYRAVYGEDSSEGLLTRPNVSRDAEGRIAHRQAREMGRDYFAMVTGVDEQFGRLLDGLDQLGLTDDTLVAFTSDHGEMMGSHGRIQKNIWYDEAMRVPLIFRHPGRLPADHADDLLVGTPDLTATIAGLLGLEASDEWMGVDYAPALLDASLPRPDSQFYLNAASGHRGVRTHRYTLALHHPATAFGQPEATPEPPRLYDNLNDPYQLEDVAAADPGRVRELTEQVVDWCVRTDDPWRPS